MALGNVVSIRMNNCSAEGFRFDTLFENNLLMNFHEITSAGLHLDETLNWQFPTLVTINVLASQRKNPTNKKSKSITCCGYLLFII